MESCDAPFLFAQDHALSLDAHHDLILGIFEVAHRDEVPIFAGSQKCGLIYQVFQVSPGKSRRALGQCL